MSSFLLLLSFILTLLSSIYGAFTLPLRDITNSSDTTNDRHASRLTTHSLIAHSVHRHRPQCAVQPSSSYASLSP